VRSWLVSLPAEEAAKVLDERELNSLEFGARERVTDTHLEQIRDLPTQLPILFANAARRAREAGFDVWNCISLTHTRWHHSYPGQTHATTATEAR